MTRQLNAAKRRFVFSFAVSLLGHAGVILAADAAVRFWGLPPPTSLHAPAVYFQLVHAAGSPMPSSSQVGKLQTAVLTKTVPRALSRAVTAKSTKIPARRNDSFFEAAQKRINERIRKIHENLNSLPNRPDRVKTEKLAIEVPDLDKVPEPAKEELLPAYLRRVRVKIGELWIQELKRFRGQEGKTVLEFRIRPSGVISEVSSVESKGRSFENVCRAAVGKANPLEPPPFTLNAEASQSYLTVRLAFYLKRGNMGGRSAGLSV